MRIELVFAHRFEAKGFIEAVLAFVVLWGLGQGIAMFGDDLPEEFLDHPARHGLGLTHRLEMKLRPFLNRDPGQFSVDIDRLNIPIIQRGEELFLGDIERGLCLIPEEIGE